MDFVAYCERHGVATVTTDVAVAWATGTTRSRDPLWWARRLMVVRIFARYLQALDPATQVPPMDVLPHAYRRTTPYLYSPQQLADLVRPQAGCGPGCAALTYAAVIGLLASCGLRIGEACRLDGDDVDLDEGVLTVRGVEVRQVPDRARALHHPRRAADLRRAPRPAAARTRRRRRSSSTAGAGGWTPTTSRTPSPSYSPRPGSPPRPGHVGPGFTT